jgi:hypothetical protein
MSAAIQPPAPHILDEHGEVRPPQQGDVIRRWRGKHAWYGVALRILDNGALHYVTPGGPDGETKPLDREEWCYADPNREEHAGIPVDVWALRLAVLREEV